MTITVNNNVEGNPGGAGPSATATISVSTGHTIVALVQYNDFGGGGSITGVTDSSGANTYTLRKTLADGLGRTFLVFDCIGIANAVTSVSANASNSAGFPSVVAFDLSSGNTIAYSDSNGTAYVNNNPSTTDGVTTGTLSIGTASTGALVGICSDFSNGSNISRGTGFTAGSTLFGNPYAEYKTTTVSAAITYTDSVANSQVLVIGGLYVEAAAAPTVTGAWQRIRPLSPPGSLPGKLGRFYLLRKGYLSTVQTSGSSALTFAQTGTLTGTGTLAGTSALVFGQTGAVTGAGALAGTSALVFNETGALTGAGALAGESDLVFGQTGTLTQPGLNGSASIVFGQTGVLTASGVLAGTSALQFGQTAALTGAGALAGSSALVFNETGVLTAAGILAGTSALLFAQTAALTASGALAGSSALAFGASGTADLPAGALAGTSSLSFGASAALTAFGALIGSCQIIIGASGLVPATDVTPTEIPAGRRIRNIYRVTIDGQVFEFRTLQEALNLLEQAKELAAKVAEDDVIWHQPPKPPPVITVSSRELRKAAAETKREIQATYERAALHAELRMLLELSRRQEEDDTLLLLM